MMIKFILIIIYITYLVKIGINHVFLLSPKTSWKLLYFPKLKPSLSAPVRNIGALKASEKDYEKCYINLYLLTWA
jgi:hypothetical protein